MTERLYYNDCYLWEFEARVIAREADGRRIYLDRTAFYPASGGQPHDLGMIGGAHVTDVVDEDERIAHVVDAPVETDIVSAEIDWARRSDHMQQHTGQHLLSAVLVELFDIPTLSFHLGPDYSTIEVGAADLAPKDIDRAEDYANGVVWENRPVTITMEEASENLDLRKPSARKGALRIVSIEDLDRSACGGTHVRSTGEIGPILLRKLEKIRGNLRIEFLCGRRALTRARADYRALSRIARSFSSPIDETPELVEAQIAKIQESERARRKLAVELAEREGRDLYRSTAPGPGGLRQVVERCAITDVLRARASAFTAGSKSIFLAVSDDPPSVLLAASADSGVNAGAVVKEAVTAAGGRGGGSATMGQGSVPDREKLQEFTSRFAGQ